MHWRAWIAGQCGDRSVRARSGRLRAGLDCVEETPAIVVESIPFEALTSTYSSRRTV
jgi:hypothetical protein